MDTLSETYLANISIEEGAMKKEAPILISIRFRG